MERELLPMRPVRRLLPVALTLAGGLVPLCGATLERLSLDDLIAKSTAIVRGKVTGSYAAFRGPIIYTHYTVQISEQLKGTNGSSLDVVVPGGTANGLRQVYSGTPQLDSSGDYVLFLWTGPSGLTQIMGLTQGLFRLTPGASSNLVATRAASTELMLEPGTGHAVKDETLVMSLNDLRARIASRLAGRAAQ